MLINEAGTYLIMYQLVTEDTSLHNVYAILQKDTGAGFNKIDSSRVVTGGAINQGNSGHIVHQFSVGDKVQLWGADLSSTSPVARDGTGMSIIKLDVSIAGGGDLECFQQGLDDAETHALTASMAVVDLDSNIINNATDLYTFTAGTDVLTLNEAGLYMISYTVVMDETSGTLETAAKLQKDIGAGFVDIAGSESSGSGADKFTHGNTVLISLAATDEIKLMAQYTTAGGNAVAGTMLRVVRLKRGSEAFDYNTTEEKTGRKWIDGKDIYRKVVSFAALGNAAAVSQAHGITGLDWAVSITGTARDAGATRMPLPFVHLTLANQIKMFIDATNITIDTGVDRSDHTAEVLIEYTKT